MGGHGGLNILPQKKWNVYNWDNRQIVERDKKAHAEKQRQAYEKQREDLLENKMQVMKSDGLPSKIPEYKQNEKPVHSLINQEMRKMADEQKHINLFEQEERTLANREVEQLKRLKQQQFLRGKNMDFSTRFLGSYADQTKMPWYSKKKGLSSQKNPNKYIDLQDVIVVAKSDSKITKEMVEAEKREESRYHKEQRRDRTREKVWQKEEEFERERNRFDKLQSKPAQQLIKHEEDLLIQQFKDKKVDEIEKLREKRLKREQKQRQRIQQLKKKLQSQ